MVSLTSLHFDFTSLDSPRDRTCGGTPFAAA